MPSVTFTEIAQDAFALLNVFLPGEALPPSAANVARRFCNDYLDELSNRDVFIPIIARERFDLVANQGGPTSPYTIGPGGDFDTERPSNQNSIVAANLILTATSPEVRVALGIYTDQAYDANQIPDLSNTQPTGLYYNPTYDADLGSIFLWPVPTISTNDLELFLQKSVAEFADLTTTYYVPTGWKRFLKYTLADMMQVPYGKTLSPAAQRIVVSSTNAVMRSNAKLSDLLNDAYMFGYGRPTLYNINTGSGG